MATPAQAKELSWFPCYPDRLLASGKWQSMKDYQRGWYWHLLVLMTRSKPLGYLPLDGQLWTLAGAHSKQYWESHSALVLACFKVAEIDGLRWIYSEPLMTVLNQQTYKRDQAAEKGRLGGRIKLKRSKSSLIYSFEFLTIWEKNIWKCVGKPKAYKSYQKALLVIQEQKKLREDQAIEFLADAIEEFKSSPAGRDGGLFDDYTSPHPASWLNAERYFDERKTWWGTTGNNQGKAAEGTSRPAAVKSLTEANCRICEGTGWDRSSGKAAECECRKRNKAHATGRTFERCRDERASAIPGRPSGKDAAAGNDG